MADDKPRGPRLVRAHDYIAEYLEKRAARMPEGSDRDHTLRIAMLFRTSGHTEMVRVWVPLGD
jgi:hypothetical protein